jgi:hypothetical protein
MSARPETAPEVLDLALVIVGAVRYWRAARGVAGGDIT